MAAGSTYTPIATTTLGSAASTVTLSSIPSTYTDLHIVFTYGSSADGYVYITVNGDTASNYSMTRLTALPSSDRISNSTSLQNTLYGYSGAIAIGEIDIMNYASTNMIKTFLIKDTESAPDMQRCTGTWRSTSAISSITFTKQGGNFNTGSILTIYGIAAA